MSCQVPPPWGLDFWVPGPPNLGLTLPWKPEVEGDLEVIWLVCLVLQCPWRPGRGLACVSVPSQNRTVSSGASLRSSPSFSCQAGRALGQRKPPATSRQPRPRTCPVRRKSAETGGSSVSFGCTFQIRLLDAQELSPLSSQVTAGL